MENGHDVKPRLAEVASRLSSKEIPCIFCKKLWESRLTIINDKRDILGALDALGVKYEPIPGVMDYACYKCVYRINVIIDFRRLLERNINKTRANYYYAQGNKDMCRKFLLCNDANISNTANSTSSDNLNLLITDVRSEREPERTADFLFDCFNDPDMYTLHYSQENDTSALNSSRLLEPMFETEFAEAAGAGTPRSGGKYKNYNNLNDNKYNYKCQYCTKTYKRVHYLTKHERKHRAKLTRRNSTRSTVITHSYECEDCREIFETRAMLRSHERTHRNKVKCTYCPAEFHLRHDLDLHEAKCYGEISARSDAASVRTHYTRSKTKPRKRANSVEGSDGTDLDTLYSVRMRNVTKWVQNVEGDCDGDDTASEKTRRDDDDRMSITSYASSVASVFSRASTAVSASSYAGTERSSMTTRVYEHVSYDKPKLSSTLRTTKSSVCGDSKRTPSESNGAEHLKNLDDIIKSRGDQDYTTPFWQQTRNLAKRRNKARRNNEGVERPLYLCQYAKCYFFHDDLKEMMRHDIQMHFGLPFYRCRQCKYTFTRPIYLQCHTMEHNKGYHPCNLCNKTFEYSYLLKYHLELHAIRSHKCPVCPRSFVKEKELAQHITEDAHVDTMPKINVVHYKLFQDVDEADTAQPQTDNADTVGRKSDGAFTAHYRPQPFEPKRHRYERTRLNLGSELRFPVGVNQLTVEPGTDEWLNNIFSRAESPDDISLDADDERATDDDDTQPLEDISLDGLNLFSTDEIQLDEPNDKNVDQSAYGLINSITLRMKRTRHQYYSTLAWRTQEFLYDPPLPTYASIMTQPSENNKTRTMPLTNLTQPSRFPC